jgi:hypothetical protein
MANPERGEVRLSVDGEHYTLKMTIGAAIALQKAKHRPMGQLFQAVGELDMDAIAGLLWAALQVNHPRQFRSEQQVVDLIDKDGGFANLAKYVGILGELMDLNKPASGAEANPPTAQSGGTSENSTSTEAATPA